LADKFFLRFHMSLILSLTVACGYLSAKGLYLIGLTNLTARYSLSFLISYGCFFLLIRLWLFYIFATRSHDQEKDWDWWDFDGWFIGSSKKVAPAYKGSGGGFSGGGASSSFDGPSSPKPIFGVMPPVKDSTFDL